MGAAFDIFSCANDIGVTPTLGGNSGGATPVGVAPGTLVLDTATFDSPCGLRGRFALCKTSWARSAIKFSRIFINAFPTRFSPVHANLSFAFTLLTDNPIPIYMSFGSYAPITNGEESSINRCANSGYCLNLARFTTSIKRDRVVFHFI